MIWPFKRKPKPVAKTLGRDLSRVLEEEVCERVIDRHASRWRSEGAWGIGLTNYEGSCAIYIKVDKKSRFSHKTGDIIDGCPIVVQSGDPPSLDLGMFNPFPG